MEESAKVIGAELMWVKKKYNDGLDSQGKTEKNKALAKKLLKIM